MMIDLEQFIYEKVRIIFDGWDEPGIYAVSFFASSNELQEYRGFRNVTDFAVSYNTEADCPGAGPHSEARWNYAFWRQNETMVFDSFGQTPETAVLFDWYAQQGITNIGYEDDGMEAPVGYKELVDVLAKVARRFQEEGYWMQRFGRPIPILIHDLEYIQCTLDATAYANPNGEAEDFLYGNWDDDYDQDHAYNVPHFGEVRDAVKKVFADVISQFGEKDFMERILQNEQDAADKRLEEIMKILREKK